MYPDFLPFTIEVVGSEELSTTFGRKQFWVQVFCIMIKLHEDEVSPDPKYELLNMQPSDFARVWFNLMVHILTTAKQIIRKALKSDALSIVKTKFRVTQDMAHEKIDFGIYLLKEKNFLCHL